MKVVFDILMLAGSLGLFLFGMKMMSEALQKVAGEKMRSILGAMTSNPLKRILTGVLVTAVIQSSSATTVMIVSFVNAGLLSLTQSIGVIMGANIGTTVTAWIISLLGFKVDMATIAIPLIAFGFVLLMFKSRKNKSWGELIIGFAILFMGLAALKSAVPDISQNRQVVEFLQSYAHSGYGSILIFVLIGTVLTVILQSSSATMALTLVMCSHGLPFEIAVAMVMGENIGTTITANLAAAVANVPAKRAARAHFLFNVIGVIWVLILFYPFLNLITWLMDMIGNASPYELAESLSRGEFANLPSTEELEALKAKGEVIPPAILGELARKVTLTTAVTTALALFHTLFNIFNTCFLVGFTSWIVKAVTWMVKPKNTEEEEEFRLKYIQQGVLSTAELSQTQAKMEIVWYAKRSTKQFGLVRNLFKETNTEKFEELFKKIEHDEEVSDRIELEIGMYLNKISEGVSEESSRRLQAMYKAITEIESVCDSNYNLARTLMRKKNLGIWFDQDLRNNVNAMFDLLDKAYISMNENLEKGYENIVDIGNAYDCENQINNLRSQLKEEHIRSLDENKYKYQTGVVYMDLIIECETLGDYIVNVSEAVLELKHGL